MFNHISVSAVRKYVIFNDFIISGNGIKLFYSVDWRPRLSTDNEIKVKFLPGKWLKNDPVGPLATREDILTVLQSVDHILLR